MSKLFNKENFENLIETIENYGPEWIESNFDILDDQWHSGLTHKDPEILRSFGIQCWQKADLMVSIKLTEDYAKEKTTNKVADKVREDLKLEETTKKAFKKHNETKLQEQSILQFKTKKEIN
jgi:hypothetical protein|tara:strand:+ start:888 stop:1253 length:366 start_codon:yes stop_codon:yes gene_type:complete